MKFRKRSAAALLLAAAIVPAGAAFADICETETLPQAVIAMQAQVHTPDEVVARLDLMDSFVESCPDHGWINVLGAELDRTTYRGLAQALGGSPDQRALNYLLRGIERSNVFYEGTDDDRKERLNIWTGREHARLLFSVAANNRKSIIEELMTLARQGKVHPYLAAETRMACAGWLSADSQTIGYAIKTREDMIFLPFLDAAAEACRGGTDMHGRLPLGVKAMMYGQLVHSGVVTDPEEIRPMLVAAREAETAYLAGRSFDMLYSKSDADRLAALMQQHGVRSGDEPVLLARELWFTPEHVRSPEAVYSIALTLSGTWTPLAAGTEDGDTQAMAAARNKLSSEIFVLLNAGTEAGLKAETQATLREALTAFQIGAVRTPETARLPGAPAFLYDMLINILTPAVAGNAQAGD